jgi:hypothetical protein
MSIALSPGVYAVPKAAQVGLMPSLANYGAVPDGTTDNATAIAAFLAAVGKAGAGYVGPGLWNTSNLGTWPSTALVEFAPGAILLLNGVPQQRLSYYHRQGEPYNVLRETFASGSSQSTTGSITAGQTTLTVASAIDFKVGQGISVAGAGASGGLLVSQIVAISGTTFTLAAAAGTTVSNATVNHDDTAAIQAALNAAAETPAAEVVFSAYHLISSPLTFSSQLGGYSAHLRGSTAGRNSGNTVAGAVIQNIQSGGVLVVTNPSNNPFNNLRVSTLALLGPAANNTAYSGDALQVNYVQDLILEDVILAQAANGLNFANGNQLIANNLRCLVNGSNGAIITSIPAVYMEQCQFSGNSGNGISASGISSDFQLTQVLCNGNGNGNGANGVNAANCSFLLWKGFSADGNAGDQIYLNGCTYIGLGANSWFAANQTTPAKGIHLYQCAGFKIEDSWILGCTTDAAIMIEGQTAVNSNSDGQIIGCHVENCKAVLYTTNYGGRIIFADNKCNGESISGGYVFNLSTNYQWYTIHDNVFENFAGGIWYNGTIPSNANIHDNQGYNPVGALSAPAMPASGTVQANNFGVRVRVFVSGGTVSVIAINGTATGLTSGSFELDPGETITLTYTAAPTWTWFGL